MRARLVESHDIAPSVRHFTFEVLDLERFDFTPGQWISVSAVLHGKEITRAYSLASEPSKGNRFELCLNKVGDGVFSPHLFALQPGDSIDMRAPMGTFVLREPRRDSVFIATGTGVAPFRSMLRTFLDTNSPHYTLLLGVRHQADILYADEFEDMARRFPHFRFLPTLSQPGESSSTEWKGRRGRVQAHLDEGIGTLRDIDVYLCGLKAMVDDLRSILKEMGFDRKQIRYEKYD
jgi:ferredoxin-NADP reductase